MYLSRKIDQILIDWSLSKEIKPLLVRGARQVGKSTAIRELAKRFDHFLEINFEEQRLVHKLFEGNLDPIVLCDNLSVLYNVPIIPGKTIIFFDEIQACLPAISSLRFFYEKYPALHVVAAGSLLEFALEEIPSFGVGRIRSIFMYPLSFNEYLAAVGEKSLLHAKEKANLNQPLVESIHQKLLEHFKRFLVIGGMPEVVVNYVKNKNTNLCQMVLDDLITSLKSDFSKYKKRIPFLRVSEVFNAVVQQSGNKFTFTKAATDANIKQVKETIDLLIMAGLVVPVTHSAANGLPLGAEINSKKRKLILFDTGIFQRLLGLNISELLFNNNFDTINKGAIAEQFVGLELLKEASSYSQENLFFWQRESKSSNAEIDYVIPKKQTILPIEVKSGTKGSMQSLFIFLAEKKLPFGIRMSLENYASYPNIQVYPIYAVSGLVNN